MKVLIISIAKEKDAERIVSLALTTRDPNGVFSTPFADTGDKSAPPFSVTTGWPVSYESTSIPARETFNYLYNQLYALGVDINKMGAAMSWDIVITYVQFAVVVSKLALVSF